MDNSLLMICSVAVPVAAGLASLFIPERLRFVAKAVAIAVTGAALYSAIRIFIAKPVSWPAGAGNALLLADNLSAFVGIGIAAFALLVVLYSFSYVEKRSGRYYGYVLMTLGASLAAVFANNTLILLVSWGFLALTLYLLVNMAGTDASARSAKKALIIVGGTDSLLIFGLGILWLMSGTFSMDKIKLPLNSAAALIAYFSILAAAFAKAGAMPFHSWLPDVAKDAPTPVTALLPASLDKLLGIYLLARMTLNIFAMNKIVSLVLLTAGSATIVLAVIIALVQHDLKRLLGYHAVSQVGYMILGIGTGNPIGIAGGLFHMLNNAIYKSCLFLSGGNVEKRTGTTDLDSLGGLAKYMPVTFISFLVASLSISGIPPFNGFVSKWMIYQGILESAAAKDALWPLWLSAAMFGSALTLASFMKLLHAVFLGRPSKYPGPIKEAPLCMTLPVGILAVACLVFGIGAFLMPLPLFIGPAVGRQIIYIGTWAPVAATILIATGIITALAVYALSRRASFRTVSPFVGGEDQEGLGRISGTDFYNTISDLKPIGTLYAGEKRGAFDIYEIGQRVIAFFTKFLQRLHNGVLPTYMVWCLLGMVAIFAAVFLR